MKKLFNAVIPLIMMGQAAWADVAVIVNPANANPITESDIKHFYLGKRDSFADGTKASRYSLPESSNEQAEFADKALGKTQSQLKSHWARLMFTGKATPPEELETSLEVLTEVAKNPDAIGYVDASLVDETVKVVVVFQ